MILISISETVCYDKRSARAIFVIPNMPVWKRDGKDERGGIIRWEMNGNEDEKRDDDDGGNASTFKNISGSTHTHTITTI